MKKNILLASLFSLIGLSALYIAYNLFIYFKKPLLIKNLPSNRAAAKIEFDQRVENSLSNISSSTILAQKLAKQGFSINNKNENKIIAFYKENNIFCTNSWQISWTNMESDNVSNVKSSYTSGCL